MMKAKSAYAALLRKSALVGLLFWGMATSVAWAQSVSYIFDIPAEPLSAALHDFARISGEQIIFTDSLVEGRVIEPLHGRYTADEALEQLLAGTGLMIERTSSGGLMVRKRAKTGISSSDGAPGTGASVDKTPSPVNNSNRAVELAEVLVTGSHIRGDRPSSPVVVISRAEIDRSGYTTIGELMQSLPQNFAGGVNPQVAVGNAPGNDGDVNPAGSSAPDLRGIGPASTLTLVNGHRLAQGLENGSTDISQIPLALVDRIEIVTDGASAIYGSDAVAGVVNIILKRKFDGAQTSSSVGTAPDGGGAEKRVSQLLGKTWSTGDVLFAYEHANDNPVQAADRSFTASSPSPYFLLPDINSNSFNIEARQGIGAAVSAFGEGYYSKRESDYEVSIHGLPFSIDDPAHYKNYGGTTGFDFTLPEDWSATAFGTFGSQGIGQGSYRFSSATPARVQLNPELNYAGKMHQFEVNANGGLFDLPSGLVRAAVGAGYRYEGFADGFAGKAPSTPDASRDIRYVFVESSVPLLAPSADGGSQLDFDVSGRYEHYSDFGSESVPKVGLVYKAIPGLNFHSSWGRSFRAPTLTDVDAAQLIELSKLPNTAAPGGSSVILERAGGNPTLAPERAMTWSSGADYTPQTYPDLSVTVDYFNIDYKNRVATIPNINGALVDPQYASFVTLTPSAPLQQSIINSAGGNFLNQTGAVYNPASVYALVDGRPLNIAEQKIDGVDLGATWKLHPGPSALTLTADGAYLRIRQQTVPLSPAQTISGTVFNPPRFKARGGAVWSLGDWEADATANFLGTFDNIYASPPTTVGSWTTIDSLIAFAPQPGGVLSGLRASLAVRNLFDRNPPNVIFNTYRQGLNYDSLNDTPLGRFVSLQVSVKY